MLKLKEVKISERKERHFGDIMTSFSSSNALRWIVRQLGQDYYRLPRKGRDPLSKSFGRSYCSLRSWSVIGLCYWLLACQAGGGASLPRAWTVLLLGPFFLVPLPVISTRAVLPVASFRDTFFDVFSLVKILSSRSSALHFGLSFSSCCGIQLYKGVPRYGFNLSTCTTLGLDRGAFWIRYTTLDKDAITKKGCLTEDSFLFCGECYVAIHYHPVVMASTRAFYHSFASVPSWADDL